MDWLTALLAETKIKAGIAKDFKQIYPEMFLQYQKLCEKKQLVVGKLWLYKTPNKWILNFPTKTTWRKPSRVEYIESGLKAFVNGYAQRGITSIAFPPLGCGNGELDWEKQVRPLMEKYFKNLPIDIFIHLYKPDPVVPEHRDIKDMAAWLRSEPKSLGFSEVWMDLSKLIGSGISLETLTDHKIFQVKVCAESEEEGICFYFNNKKHFIPQESLIEFWNLIRNYGFSTDKIMPGGLEKVTDQLVSLFSKLPYFRPVQVSADYSTLSNGRSIGLQWVPKAESPKIFERLSFEIKPEWQRY